MNLSQEDGGLPPELVVQDSDTILKDCERVVDLFHQRGPGAMIQVALAPCSPFSVTRSFMSDSAELAEKLDVRLHTHLGETENENEFCFQNFGMRPLDYLEETGWLLPRTWLAHGIHFNDLEIKRLGRAGTAVSHCPHSNMALSSGLCPACNLEQAGSPLGLGVDGSSSNDASNAIEEVRAALMLQRLREGSAKVGHLDALRWATKGGAECLGRDDLGEISVGKQADLAMFKLEELRHSGHGDPLAALVLCGANRADWVMVGGKWLVENGNATHINEADLIRRHNQAARKLRQISGLEA